MSKRPIGLRGGRIGGLAHSLERVAPRPSFGLSSGMLRGTPPYIELHCHSGFSFLDGASHLDELIGRALELGYPALALTDHNGLYGSMEFARRAREHGLMPITGAELTLRGCFGESGPPELE